MVNHILLIWWWQMIHSLKLIKIHKIFKKKSYKKNNSDWKMQNKYKKQPTIKNYMGGRPPNQNI